jgi:hypothetical protein
MAEEAAYVLKVSDIILAYADDGSLRVRVTDAAGA